MDDADLDQLARDVGAAPVLPPPGDGMSASEQAEEWISDAERRRLARERELRRGYLVAILTRVAVFVLAAGASLLAGALFVMWIGGWWP